MLLYTEIAVDSSAPQKTYTYAVPQGMAVSRGQAVWVPFGNASRLTQGIVFDVTDVVTVPNLKAIDSLIEFQPLLSQVQCDLAQWLSDYYFAPLFDCAALMMPPGFRQRVSTTIELLHPRPSADALLPERAKELLRHLQARGAPLELQELRRSFGSTAESRLRLLVHEGLVVQVSRFQRPRAGPRFQNEVALTLAGGERDLDDPSWRRRRKQRAVLEALRRHGQALTMPQIREELGSAPVAMVRALERQGLVTVHQLRVTRDPLANRSVQVAFAPTLTHHQAAALEPLLAALAASQERAQAEPTVFLLHGVTGSGKTEVYLNALEACVARGRRGIVLVPEIALEPQTVARFAGRFPGRVAVLHSGLSAGEAYDEWWRIREGEFDVVIGSRSALFSPQPDLGLVIMDESHESTYKQQDPAPRYHTGRVAQQLAQATGAVVVLGSATPDLESYLHALERRYQLLELPERVTPPVRFATGGLSLRGLPSVEVVDMRQELRAGNRSIFSGPLRSGLFATLHAGQQAILFLNRRGDATFVQCRDCGNVVRCRRCEAPLTYHSAEERLQCHQCNARRAVPERCGECGSARIKFLGAGTQRVEHEVQDLLPGVRVLRWDRDTTHARTAHEQLLERFAAHEADILVGTQMIAKGLDLPKVTLVGVVNADVNLYLPDFRAAERTFQLLTQVAGRAGRGPWAGNVVIQTYTPEHYAITAAARQDYQLFAHQELAFRHRHGYPPFQPLIRLLYADVQTQRAQREATAYAQALTQERARAGLAGVTVLGPVSSYFRRVRGRFRWQVLLKGTEGRVLLHRRPPPRGWMVEVDPLHVL